MQNNWKANMAFVFAGMLVSIAFARFIYTEQQRTRDVLVQQNAERVERSHNSSIERQQVLTELKSLKESLGAQRYSSGDIARDMLEAERRALSSRNTQN